MIVDATGSQAKALLGFAQKGGRLALDVGCGLGEKTALIARHLQFAVGIDPDADRIRAAHARHRGPNLQFQVARAESLCFANASFDAILLNESLHHVPIGGQAEAIHECRRVLKPRGRLLVIEPICGSGSIGRTMGLFVDEAAPKQNARNVIETAATAGFTRRAQSEILIEYHCQGFEDFCTGLLTTKPKINQNTTAKQAMRTRLKRCRQTAAGDFILDYRATVWQLRKS